jgi:hypothetical protein
MDEKRQKNGQGNSRKHSRTHVPVEGYKIEELQQKPLDALVEIARKVKVDNPNEFQRKDLIFEILKAQVNRAFHTSLEVGVRVEAENPLTGELRHCSSAYLTFVAQDEDGSSVSVPDLIPETDNQKRRYEEAEDRRRFRLERRRLSRNVVIKRLQK